MTAAREKVAEAFRSSLGNRYLLANCFYFAYASSMLVIDYNLYPSYLDASNAGDSDKANSVYARINSLYLGMAIIHLINSLQYYWSWLPAGYRWHHRVMVPEYLNALGASIYLFTATLYPQCSDTFSDTTITVHHWETAASIVEVFAAFGWAYTWWLTFPRGVVGRGFTLDDPDLWGIIFIVVPSLVYAAYNFQILKSPEQYGSNFLYVTGDLLYWFGSVAYLAASLRDDGWFFFMPAGGKFEGASELQSYEPDDLVFDDEEEDKESEGQGLLLSPQSRLDEGRPFARKRVARRGLDWFCSSCIGCGCPKGGLLSCCRRRRGSANAKCVHKEGKLDEREARTTSTSTADIGPRQTSLSLAALPGTETSAAPFYQAPA